MPMNDREAVRPVTVQDVFAARSNWLLMMFGSKAVRRRLAARATLFSSGDLAASVYCLERGELQILGNRGPIALANLLIQPGELFIAECGGVHFGTCAALIDSLTLQIDRCEFERQVKYNAMPAALLQSAHVRDLELILDGVRAHAARLDRGDFQAEVAKPARIAVSSRRWGRSALERHRSGTLSR